VDLRGPIVRGEGGGDGGEKTWGEGGEEGEGKGKGVRGEGGLAPRS